MTDRHQPAEKSRRKTHHGPVAETGGERWPLVLPGPAAGVAGIWHLALQTLHDQYLAEIAQRRTFLWVPVLFAVGILIYFELPREPYLPATVLLVGALSAIAAFNAHTGRPNRVWTILAIVALGTMAANLRTSMLNSPILAQPVFVTVHGTVLAVDERAGRRPRLVLGDPVIEARRPVNAPRRIRISLTGSDSLPPIGQRIMLRARVGPVPGPAMPGGYDPRRAAFFDGIGASGFALGKWQAGGRDGGTQMPYWTGFRTRIEALRQLLVRRILESQPGTPGAVAAALLVGERGHIPADRVQDLRDAGLAHILAISGLHMALFAGTFFVFIRGLLALSVPLSLTRPIKKWAAWAALFAAFLYLLLSGGSVATLRAFIMAAIMFGAVIVDRPALSLRNLAIAALAILAVEPESVTEPGFQMSFAAVAALIAFYEAWRDRVQRNLAEPPSTPAGRMFRSTRRSFAAIAMTTIIAGLATGPIGAFHFNHVALYSLFGNLLAIPLLTLIVMPFGLLSLILMPFGLEAWPLAVMATGTGYILDIAALVSGREGATMLVASANPVVFLVYLAGFLWLCLWRLRWRWLGFGPILVAFLLAQTSHDAPDILVSNTGKMVAVRDASGALRVSARQANGFVLEQWFRHEGRDVPDRSQMRNQVTCDSSACLVELPAGGVLAHIRKPSAFAEECRLAAIIVTPLDAPQDCASELVIDRVSLAHSGAQTINLQLGGQDQAEPHYGFHLKTAYPSVRRPWQGITGE